MPKVIKPAARRKTGEQVMADHSEAADQQRALIRQMEQADPELLSLDELQTLVKDAHASVQHFESEALRAAIIVGRALIAAQKQFSYRREQQGFRGWIKAAGLSKSSAYRYLKLGLYEAKVSQAGTLSEAYRLLATLTPELAESAEVASTPVFVPLRMTTRLLRDNEAKLQRLAAARNIPINTLVAEVLEAWLQRQPDPEAAIDVQSS